jgi:hypothetical protein
MPKLSLAGFKDPVRRPRYLIWTAVAVMFLALFVVAAFGVTSTYWFCAEVCHKVQDDAIIAYDRSAHNKVSCMSCHEPVNANPITFAMMKAKALGELYYTVTGKYEIPLNAESHLAMNEEEMGSRQCTQCHNLDTRTITPSSGVIINHDVHEENEIHCTVCHNRTGHVEDFELTLTDPQTGQPAHKHEDFMRMQGCARCHALDGKSELGKPAPGECATCHPADFPLKPENHTVAGFYALGGESSGHWKLKEEDPEYCRICHNESVFCVDCHGVEMPHPADFVENHGEEGTANAASCAKCHAKGTQATKPTGTLFCNGCHHKDGDPSKPWIPQHFDVVRKVGAEACFECHSPTYCAECHVRGAK